MKELEIINQNCQMPRKHIAYDKKYRRQNKEELRKLKNNLQGVKIMKRIYEHIYLRNLKASFPSQVGLLTIILLSSILLACGDMHDENKGQGGVVVEDSVEDIEKDPICEESIKDSASTTVEPPIEGMVECPISGKDRTPDLVIDVIFKEEKIGREVFIGHVNAGDKVVVHIIRGLKVEQTFSDYENTVESSWTVQKCQRSPETYKGLTECFESPQKGECQVSYRDYLGEIQSPIEFEEGPENLPLKLKIGGHEYDFDSIELRDRYSADLSFTVNQEMLQGTNKLYLKPMTDIKADVKVGFLEYRHCPSQKERNFSIGKAASSRTMKDKVRREFKVNLEIMRGSSRENSGRENQGN